MDILEKAIYAVVGFVGGFLANLIKLLAPSYTDAVKENHEQRERIRGLEDTVRDSEDRIQELEERLWKYEDRRKQD